MALEGVEHSGQQEVWRSEVTRTSTSAGVSLTDVISRPSGNGNKGEVGIYSLEKRFLGGIDRIVEEVPENSTFASPKSWKSQNYAGVDSAAFQPDRHDNGDHSYAEIQSLKRECGLSA